MLLRIVGHSLIAAGGTVGIWLAIPLNSDQFLLICGIFLAILLFDDYILIVPALRPKPKISLDDYFDIGDT